MKSEKKAWLRVKPGSVHSEDGLLKWEQGDPRKRYDPFEKANLIINAFAKVEDEKSAIRFVERYGPLGYYHLASKGLGGEPLEWVLGQADTIRFALSLIQGLGGPEELGSTANLKRVFSERQSPKYKGFMNAEHGVCAVYSVAAGARFPVETIPFRLQNPPAGKTRTWTSEEDFVRQHARDVLAYLVEHNTGSVRRVLVSATGELGHKHEFGSLIEAIWYMVGDKALLSQERGGGVIASCEECGNLFVASRKPARGHFAFCPPELSGQKYSLCGLRNRMRRLRKVDKKGKGGSRIGSAKVSDR